MKIVVCPLSRVAETAERHAPERIISLLDPETPSPTVRLPSGGGHLRLSFHDVHVAGPGVVVPTGEHIAALLKFVATWERRAPLLIHCRAGIGRSTAAAFIAYCLFNAGVPELHLAKMLRQKAPLARPNETVVRLADEAMNRRGRMVAAIAETGRDLAWIDVDEGETFALPVSYRAADHT